MPILSLIVIHVHTLSSHISLWAKMILIAHVYLVKTRVQQCLMIFLVIVAFVAFICVLQNIAKVELQWTAREEPYISKYDGAKAGNGSKSHNCHLVTFYSEAGMQCLIFLWCTVCYLGGSMQLVACSALLIYPCGSHDAVYRWRGMCTSFHIQEWASTHCMSSACWKRRVWMRFSPPSDATQLNFTVYRIQSWWKDMPAVKRLIFKFYVALSPLQFLYGSFK